MGLWSRIANVFRGERVNREIDEELQAHLEEAVEHGRDPEEVRKAFGSTLRHRETSRDIRIFGWLDSLYADAIFGWRQLRKNKITSAATILSLALAMGACTAAFRLIDALLLRPLPVAEPERIHVIVFEGGGGADGKVMRYDSCSYPMFKRMRSDVKEQAELIAVSYADRYELTYGSDQEIEKEYMQFVSGWMFPSFQLQPALGRLFTEADDRVPGAAPYAVLSYDYWTRRFGRDPGVIGRSFRMGEIVYQIIGVAEKDFTGTETGTATGIFVPMMMKNPQTLASPDNFWLRTFVQLKPGTVVEPVQEKLRATFHAIQEERAKTLTGLSKQRLEAFFKEKLFVDPAAAGRSNLQRDYKGALTILALLVALVLMIACANVANLMTAQATARAREMALRVSIGAGRSRLVQQVLVESALRAFLAAIVGGLFAWWSAPLVVNMIQPPGDPTRLFLPADWRVLGFGAALSLTVTLLFGVIPALRASAVKPISALKGGEDQPSRRRLMQVLVSAQVAFCFLVVFVAGLFVTTFERLSHQATGFSAERVINLEALTNKPQLPAFWDQVADHLRAIPGVENVAITGWPLMSGESRTNFISIAGAPENDVFCDFVWASPGLMDTMKIPFLDGRDFRPDEITPGVAIVNQTFANQYFDGKDPVGQMFEIGASGKRTGTKIIGFVQDARSRDNLRRPIRPTAYIPFQVADAAGALQPTGRETFVVRTFSQNPLALASFLRQEVPKARPEFHVTNIRTQTEIDQSSMLRERLLATLALFFAVVAALLAGVGLYGVLHYSILQQRREIGIRIAVGAQASNIIRSVTNEVFWMVLAGASAGVALGMVSVRTVESLFYQVKATDTMALTIPSLIIFGVAAIAAAPAVVRAVRIDPAVMLRAE